MGCHCVSCEIMRKGHAMPESLKFSKTNPVTDSHNKFWKLLLENKNTYRTQQQTGKRKQFKEIITMWNFCIPLNMSKNSITKNMATQNKYQGTYIVIGAL